MMKSKISLMATTSGEMIIRTWQELQLYTISESWDPLSTIFLALSVMTKLRSSSQLEQGHKVTE
jgi:hypothetical protein